MISSIIQNRPQKFCDKTEATTGNQYVQRWAIFELQLSLELIKKWQNFLHMQVAIIPTCNFQVDILPCSKNNFTKQK